MLHSNESINQLGKVISHNEKVSVHTSQFNGGSYGSSIPVKPAVKDES